MKHSPAIDSTTDDADLTRLCLESLYEVSEGMPEECYSVDPECKPARWWRVDGHWTCGRCQMYFDPLTQDEHAMRLIKAHTLDVTWGPGEQRWRVGLFAFKDSLNCEKRGNDLNRCIVECVAELQASGQL